MQKKKITRYAKKAGNTTLDRKINRRDLEMTYDWMCGQRTKTVKNIIHMLKKQQNFQRWKL